MKTLYIGSVMGLVLAGCQIGDGLEDYYGDGTAPELSGIDVTSVAGNVSGGTATLSGSGFGDDPDQLTVVFGHVNAEVLEVSDSSAVVAIPQGPIHGGDVDIYVGTPGGRAVLEDGFSYEIGDVYDGQSAYIVINNDWFSCYGGAATGSGCQETVFVGLAGIKGRGEFLEETTFPRQHGMFTGYWGGADVSMGEWSVSTPAYNYAGLDIESAVEDLRDKRVTGFTMSNAVYDAFDDNQRNYCADLSSQATWTYGGGAPVVDEATGEIIAVSDSIAVSEGGDLLTEANTGSSCEDPDDRLYDLSQMRFCETYDDEEANLQAYERAGTWIYEAEWPIAEHSFFAGKDSEGDAEDLSNAEIELDVPDVGVNETIVLPPLPFFTATAGITDTFMGGQMWGVGSFDQCPDVDGDGSVSLDGSSVRFEWLPADLGDVVGGNIEAVDNTVRVSLNAFYLGWYGGEGFTMRATTTVPDANEVDAETGLATLEIPTDVLLQFPSLTAAIGEQSGPFGNTFIWGDPLRGDYGYLIVTLERVTEYRINTPELTGDLVVAYAAGDFGFFDWNNPLDSTDDCGDCQDGDGDGWADAADPDCEEEGGTEDNSTFGLTTCNDGLDNDDDGLVDAEDPDCEDGYDGETNCSDGIDNDGDGLTDGLDGECGPEGSGVEVGDDDPDWQCSNGLDDDGDTWIDFEDPDCSTASDEEIGFGTTECNDGIDNDGHGDIDSEDLICAFRGADYETEAPERSGDCIDDVDNDGDGYIDRNDPDCEIQPYSVEAYDEARSSWGWTSECYNGIDDDADGDIDAIDPGCEDGTGVPDGFLNDEAAADAVGGDTGTR